MKNTRAHLLSSVLGGAVVAGFLLVMGMAQSTYTIALVGAPIRVEGIPAPDQLVTIKEGDIFTVPDDKVLVITGIVSGVQDPQDGQLYTEHCSYRVFVEDVPMISGELGYTSGSHTVLSCGFRVTSGANVRIDDNNDQLGSGKAPPSAIILGYLADA